MSRYLLLFVNYYLLIIKRICFVKTVSFYFHGFLSGMYILLFFGVISIFLKLISTQMNKSAVWWNSTTFMIKDGNCIKIAVNVIL